MFEKIKNKYNDIQQVNIDKFIYASIFIFLVGFMINGCALKISDIISKELYYVVDGLAFIIEGVIVGCTLLLLLIKNPKRIISIYGISGLVFLLSYLIFPQNRYILLSKIIEVFLYDITAFTLFFEVSQDERIFSKLIKWMKILFVFSLLYLLILLFQKEQIYNVWLARHFFIIAIFTTYNTYKNRNENRTLLISVLCLIALIITGSRTYLLLDGLFIVLLLSTMFIQKLKNTPKKKRNTIIIFTCIIIIIFAILLINYQIICDSVYNFLARYGIKIRILRLLATNNLFTSNERINIIYPTAINSVKDNWAIGLGLYGDRPILYEEFEKAGMLREGYNPATYYSHNIILELYESFGIFIASIIIAFIIYSMYKTIKYKRSNKDIVICLFFVSIMPLMLNGTFLENIYFWMLMAVLLSNIIYKEKKNRKKTSNNVVMLLDNAFEPDIRVYKEAKYLVDNNLDIEIVCLDKKNKYKDKATEQYDGINIKRFFSRTEKTTKLIEKYNIINKLKSIIYFWWLLKFIVKIKRYLKNKEFEILHCHDLVMAFIGCAFFKDKKIVFDMHEYYSDSKNKLRNFIIRRIVSYTQNRSTWIIYVNEFQKNGCKERNMHKFIELPNYPETKKFSNVEKTSSDKIRIAYIGKVRDFSSLSKLISCNVDDNLVNISIYGDGSEYENLLKFSKENNKGYIMKGEYNGIEDTEEIYNNTDILYAVYDANKYSNTLNWKNAMPIKSYEAIITLTPIIASKNTTLGEFVEKYNIGYTIDISKDNEVDNLINEISKNPMLITEKKENMKRIQYSYTWNNIVKNLNKIYKING